MCIGRIGLRHVAFPPFSISLAVLSVVVVVVIVVVSLLSTSSLYKDPCGPIAVESAPLRAQVAQQRDSEHLGERVLDGDASPDKDISF